MIRPFGGANGAPPHDSLLEDADWLVRYATDPSGAALPEGPLLEDHYWRPGNSVTHDATLRSLTGESLSGRALAASCGLSVDEAWAVARESVRPSTARGAPDDGGGLAARVRVVHGSEVIAGNGASGARMCAEFERWIEARDPPA